jgi:ankyrin repeat protein
MVIVQPLLRGFLITALCAVLLSGCRRSNSEAKDLGSEGAPGNSLLVAAQKGEASKVKSLLASGADPNASDPEGNTALQFAAASGKLNVVEQLIASGANVHMRDRHGSTALHAAAIDRDVRFAELLLAAGADVNARTLRNVTPLMASIGSPYSDSKMSLALIRAGADVNIADSDGVTALWTAATTGSEEVIEELLKRGADPNVQPRSLGYPGYTPLHMASVNGATKTVQLLLKFGADPHIRNDEGQTPLDVTNVKFDQVRQILSNVIQK